ncbi:MAG TPA: sigma 54-interacting transcriptional regulator [Phycisphaerae bacterium]
MQIASDKLAPPALAALTEASAALISSLDPPTVLDTIARSAAKVMRADASSVLLLDRARKKLVFVAAVGTRGDVLLGEEFDASLGIAGRVAATGKPELIGDVQSSRHFFKGMDDKSAFQTRELMAAAMVWQSEIVGVIEVLNRSGGGDFDESELELLQVFANLAAAATRNAQAHDRLHRNYQALREVAQGEPSIIGRSPALAEVLKLVDRVARSNATVLLLGETGTGKEVTARHLHERSERRDKPFIAINCAALTETLLESELFGHEKGAFTSAIAQKIGRFEMAEGGTLFLDEIGDISLATQVKLLRVLQEREFVRVGGTRTLSCDVRIIAATNRDLKKGIADGRFREDLYYRLNVFPLQLPPLRARREDVPMLAEHFAQRSSIELGRPTPKLSTNAVAVLTAHNWPGNIRELQNVMERAVLMCDGSEILPTHLPRELAGSAAEAPAGDESLWGFERAMIVKALTDARWNQSKAARTLGISRDNLRYRIKKYNIERADQVAK